MADEGSFSNVLKNAASPIDIRFGKQVQGAIQYVGAEVIVEYLLRWVLKADKRTLLQLGFTHGVSLPLIGGTAAVMEGQNPMGYDASVGNQFWDASKEVPGMFAGMYVANTVSDGFHIPKLGFKDVLISGAAKILTRPLVSLLYPYIGNMGRNGFDTIAQVIYNQRANSSLLSEDDPDYISSGRDSGL
jgi:hypothetical protein